MKGGRKATPTRPGAALEELVVGETATDRKA